METEKQPLLSFAIPTYNFGKFIAETVKTIEDGAEMLASSQFEIVILDGGSKDNTDDVVHALAEQYENIRYIKQAERGGIDRDMSVVAEMARGKYIWLFSADDLLERGWDRCIVPLLDRGGDVFLVPAILCDIRMIPLRQNPIFRGCTGQEPIEFDINPGDDLLGAYLNRAASLEALFSYMSSVVVNANVWRALPAKPDYFGSCWAHCVRLMPLFFHKTKIIYLNRFLIKKRRGNDSFLSNGFVARIALAVDGWDKIISEFFIEASLRQVLYSILRKDMPILLFIYAKISAKKTCEIQRLNSMVRLLYLERSPSSTTRINYLFYRLTPASAVLNAMISPFLPVLIRIRHKVKSMFL
ncbi:MAG: glycosyltransferase family 2 protein [Proteobacteria bacterium]|nr:glycosyltransferase family 2 protein [Pseudomonadota bacterium]MBU1299225.1 glycosyltransferase family 2 protein [Bacteroidota bacterium]MBU1569944.1 glycosyltransferase family 2 protein [Pseudomonadota bacterium]